MESNADLGTRLVVVGHHDPARFDEIGVRFGVPCLTPEDLLDRSDVDVICVCTPSGRHAGEVVAAAEAGKHVLVEKPMALSLDEANAAIRACDRARVELGWSSSVGRSRYSSVSTRRSEPATWASSPWERSPYPTIARRATMGAPIGGARGLWTGAGCS